MLGRFLLAIIGLIAMTHSLAQDCSATSQSDTSSCTQSGRYIAYDKFGKVIISPGKCAKNSLGDLVCSDTPDGGAMVNRLGQVITGKGKCLKNQSGDVICAPTQGGGAAIDKLGQVRTGPGNCINDKFRDVVCASEPYGAAALDRTGQPVCAGGCVPGQ